MGFLPGGNRHNGTHLPQQPGKALSDPPPAYHENRTALQDHRQTGNGELYSAVGGDVRVFRQLQGVSQQIHGFSAG